MSNSVLNAAIERASKIKLMIFDVDGVFTDGGLRYGAEGELIKTFNVLDGHGIKLLQEYGVQVGIITARNSSIVARRAADLGIQHLKQGVHDKRLAFEQVIEAVHLTPEESGFMGDDVIDVPVMRRVGFSAAPADALPEVLKIADYVARANGGWGAVRELCDLVLKGRGVWQELVADRYEL
jgi:3-deoxy-D-manno-octulosonate 8-phosphate phosphatase (KDO 8-P phosphatase)